jgi:hypothetical protein
LDQPLAEAGAQFLDRPRRRREVATIREHHLRTSSGSLAIFAAIRRASSFLSSLAADRRPASSSRNRHTPAFCSAPFLLLGAVVHDKTGVIEFFDGPGRREAAFWHVFSQQGGKNGKFQAADRRERSYG